jgi:hypothetical protein
LDTVSVLLKLHSITVAAGRIEELLGEELPKDRLQQGLRLSNWCITKGPPRPPHSMPGE